MRFEGVDELDFGAGDRIRTGDINLGKVALYQLSYSRAAKVPPILARCVAIVNSVRNLECRSGETRINPNVLPVLDWLNYIQNLLILKNSKNGIFLFPSGTFVLS